MSSFNPDLVAGWLATLWPRSNESPDIIAGIDEDDCGVIRIGAGFLIATTDFLNKKPIVEQLGVGDLMHLGRLTVASSLSDLYGSGAVPIALLIGAAMSPVDTLDDFRQFMEGVHYESNRWKVPVIGGDSKIGRDRAFFGVGIGFAPSERNLFLKNGARAGDLLWLSGKIGGCAGAVLGLTRLQPTPEWREWAVRALIDPRLPARQSTLLSRSEVGHGGTDISDGLAYDLGNMCKASNVGAIISVERLPIPSGVHQISSALGYPEWVFGFGTGGDFQFLATSSPEHRDVLGQSGFYEIGVIVEGRDVSIEHPRIGVVRLPELGHSDARGLPFADEVEFIMTEIMKIANRN